MEFSRGADETSRVFTVNLRDRVVKVVFYFVTGHAKLSTEPTASDDRVDTEESSKSTC